MYAFLKPTDFHSFPGIELGNVGFDIQKRGAIHNVQIFNVKNIPFDSDKLDYGNADWVGSVRRSCGKYPTFVDVQERCDFQRRSFGKVEVI